MKSAEVAKSGKLYFIFSMKYLIPQTSLLFKVKNALAVYKRKHKTLMKMWKFELIRMNDIKS